MFPGKEELGFVKYVLKCFILIGQSIIRDKKSFAVIFLEEANTTMNRQCPCVCLQHEIYSFACMYKQEARGNLYSGWIYITNYAINLKIICLSQPSAVFPVSSLMWW